MPQIYWLNHPAFPDFLKGLEANGHAKLVVELKDRIRRNPPYSSYYELSKWMTSKDLDGSSLARHWTLFLNRRRQATHRERKGREVVSVRIDRDLRDRLMRLRCEGETLSDAIARLLPTPSRRKRD